ncbi:hypothetical protein OsI_36689 [Oryza sativa Indica Group]|uniref:Uncharacterized protein n=1 Tax=Oryza sativa subsp. indica TaxID=39946 RepID=B8BLC7_ORYSI|nr:hypothetical protein OsI_36689 [Oryza sativa Indica Group]
MPSARLTKSNSFEPVNIATDEMVTMNEMAAIVLSFENKQLQGEAGAEGVRATVHAIFSADHLNRFLLPDLIADAGILKVCINITELLCFQENFNIPYPKETDSKSTEEMSSTTGNENVDVNKEITDKDLFILHPIIQSLWNLRYLRDEFLMGKPAWILNISGNCCIADLIYGIFSAWENNEHDRVAVLLASVKSSLCKIANDNMFQKLQSGKRIASEVVATVFQGLHISEASLHFCFNNEIEGRVINSFADLPVLYDQQLCFEDNCEYCGSSKKVDVSPFNTPHFFTIGLDWFGGSEDQGRLSELLVGIAHPLDIKLLCKGVRFSANYSLASMISYADGRYVCFARNQDKWLICDAENVEAADSWELLLERFSVCRLQPEVLFFEVIK